MDKKLSLAALSLSTLLISPAIIAGGFTVSLGVQGAQQSVNTQSKGEAEPENPGPRPINSVSYDLSSTNRDNDIGGEIAVGYQYDINDVWNVALEFFGQIDGTQTNVPSPLHGFGESIRTDMFDELYGREDARGEFDWTAGVRLRPGYMVTDNTRLFVDGGVVWGDYEVTMTANDAALLNRSSRSKSDTLMGWRYGFGIEHFIMNHENISLVLDYSKTDYESLSIDFEDIFNPNLEWVGMHQNDYTPTVELVTLSLKATFDPGFGF